MLTNFSLKPKRGPARDWAAEEQANLGEKFRDLPADEQRRSALRLIENAEARRNGRLRLSILIDRDNPPDIEWHRTSKGVYAVGFEDREAAIEWVIKAYGLGFAVAHSSSMLGVGSLPFRHPCEDER